MRLGRPLRLHISRKFQFGIASSLTSLSLAVVAGLAFGLVTPAAAQEDNASRRAAAEGQFQRAEALRATLEAKPERERSLREYETLVSAYRRVYLITPNAVQVPPAIKNVADLYRRMGEQFEAKYFDSAIETDQYLIREYPESSLREGAFLAIAEIRRNNLSQADVALKNYQDFLDQYPHSSYAPQVRKTIAEIQAAAAKPKAAPERASAAPRSPYAVGSGGAAGGDGTAASMNGRVALGGPAVNGTNAAAAASDSGGAIASAAPGEDSEVSHVRIWNADNYTRIIIELGGKAYFDIENAKLSNELLHQPIEIPSGSYLKAVRVAQNRSDVVRVVLDVAKVKDYSVFELADPDRLVVDVYGPTGNATAASAADTAASTAPANSGAKANTRTAALTPTSAPAPRAMRVQTPPTAALGALPVSAKASASLLTMPATPKVSSASAVALSDSLKSQANNIGPAPVPQPTRNGEHSLTRVLGLKIGRIVIDPGHGGHDTGTIGPTGLMEKDLCLDVALRLGRLIERSLPSAEIIYTRQDDRFVGLEQRTAIANDAHADLFISIHANSSDDARVSGIETYYLNFNASAQAMEVAARENATAQSTVHDLQDLVTKIARNEKIEESRDLAANIQESLATSMQIGKRPERNRGVRKAPFVVLVGADMPSVLAEISFISNPADEQLLKKPENRQHAADGLYHGIERYLRSVNSLTTTIGPSLSSPRPQ
jgi:N-acetylmuramoyl-L-alanine amidase